MSFAGIVLKNPFRNRARLILSVLGIAVGIATIVALGMVTEGLKENLEEQLKSGEADFMVMKNTTSGSYTIKESYVAKIENMNGITQAAGVYTGSGMVNGKQMALVGMDSQDLGMVGVKITQGSSYVDNENEIIIGKLVAEKLKKNVGDEVTLAGKKYKIKGIFETGNMEIDDCIILSLEKVQEIAGDEGKVHFIYVKIDNNADLKTVAQSVEKAYPTELTTISSLEDFQRANDGLNTIDTAAMAISLLAIVIGGIGIINTMMMSVFERTREIGVLKAMGWKNRRVLGMILGESIVLTALAGIVGILLGVIGINIIIKMAGLSLLLVFTPSIAFKAMIIAIVVGLIGGVYPAIRASRLQPTEALRYE